MAEGLVLVELGWGTGPADRDCRPLLRLGALLGGRSTSSVISVVALCLWKGFLLGDPEKNIQVKHLVHYVNLFRTGMSL